VHVTHRDPAGGDAPRRIRDFERLDSGHYFPRIPGPSQWRGPLRKLPSPTRASRSRCIAEMTRADTDGLGGSYWADFSVLQCSHALTGSQARWSRRDRRVRERLFSGVGPEPACQSPCQNARLPRTDTMTGTQLVRHGTRADEESE
jgi:hypothetical protein